ncbi:MAG: porin [Gammaproteobacteria bacterium]|nr:MAG: porin [Gammaproteobacteria bacterium]
MKIKNKHLAIAIALASTATMVPATSQAAGTITFGEDQYVSVGFGMRSSFSNVEDAANDGGDSNDFALDSARLYVAGSLNKYIKGMFNTEKSGGNDTFQIIDAAGIFQITPDVAIWAGRFLSPSSRANMAGPYYTSGDGYWQNISARYGWNGGTIGRDDGAAVVGTAFDQRLAYSFGAFEADKIFLFSGVNDVTNNANQSDDLMYAGRLQYSFWDKEPGYYGTGNYLGAKDIFTIGVAARQKGDGSASATAVGDYSQWVVDLLVEKKLSAGAVSFEAAYYDYDTDDVFTSEQGEAYALGAGFIFNEKVGWGQFMPFVHYQNFDADNNIETERTDFGVNYIIDGYNAQLSAVYRNLEVTGSSDVDSFVLGMQLQF